MQRNYIYYDKSSGLVYITLTTTRENIEEYTHPPSVSNPETGIQDSDYGIAESDTFVSPDDVYINSSGVPEATTDLLDVVGIEGHRLTNIPIGTEAVVHQVTKKQNPPDPAAVRQVFTINDGILEFNSELAGLFHIRLRNPPSFKAGTIVMEGV